MPLTSIVTTPMFLSNLAANLIIGMSTPQLATALATGLEIYAGSGLQAQSVDVGVLGAGVGAGVGLVLAPPVLIGALTASFSSHGLLGVMAAPKINALALSFSQAFAQAAIVTASPSVGVGGGVVTAVPNTAASVAAFQAGFASAGIVGPMTPNLVSAIAQGLDSALPSGIGAVVIGGSPSIVPSGGSGTGVFV